MMGVFLVIIIALGWTFSQVYGDPLFIYIAVAFSLGMNFLSYWHSDKIVLRLSGAKSADEGEYRELHRLVENLAITAGLMKPRIYIINDSAPNAFATGRDEKHAVVAVTQGLLDMLNKTELEGVLAHELSHIGNKDMLLQTIVVILAGTVSILANMFLRISFWGGGRNRDDNKGNLGLILMILGIVAAILAPIAASLIQMAISRKREFLADASGALLTRYPEGLAMALEKISQSKLICFSLKQRAEKKFSSNF